MEYNTYIYEYTMYMQNIIEFRSEFENKQKHKK